MPPPRNGFPAYVCSISPWYLREETKNAKENLVPSGLGMKTYATDMIISVLHSRPRSFAFPGQAALFLRIQLGSHGPVLDGDLPLLTVTSAFPQCQ